LTNVTEAEKQAHVDQINEKFHKNKYEKANADEGRKEAADINVAPEIKDDAAGDVKQFNNVDQKAPEDINTEVNQNAPVIKTDAEQKAAADALICPKCGAKLTLRTAQKGENKGRQFYGCSNFPKCRFIKNISS